MHAGMKVEAGSAARDAEQRKRESGPTPRSSVSLRISRTVGQKFEVEPVKAAPSSEASTAGEMKTTPRPSMAARIWNRFLGVFRSM
jgi:hypothetical protein